MGLSRRRGDAEGANFESAYALRGYGVTSCGFWIRLRASRLQRDRLRIFLRGSATNFGALHFLMPLNSNPAELATELTEAPEEANLELRISDCVVRNFYKPGLSVETGAFA